MYIQGKLLSYNDDLKEVYQIRRKVFIEEQGIPEELDLEYLDKEAIHAIAYETDKGIKAEECNSCKKAVATGRLSFDGVNCRIGQVAVMKEYRGKEYGEFIVKMLLNKAFSSGIKEVTLKSQISTQGFFDKMGFYRTGDSFVEDGIEYCELRINDCNLIRNCHKNSKLYGI